MTLGACSSHFMCSCIFLGPSYKPERCLVASHGTASSSLKVTCLTSVQAPQLDSDKSEDGRSAAGLLSRLQDSISVAWTHLALHNCDTRVSCAEVDPNNFISGCSIRSTAAAETGTLRQYSILAAIAIP